MVFMMQRDLSTDTQSPLTTIRGIKWQETESVKPWALPDSWKNWDKLIARPSRFIVVVILTRLSKLVHDSLMYVRFME